MTRKELEQKHRDYWEAMPEWVREGYNNEPIVHHVVQRCLHGGIPASELVSKVGEALLAAYKASVKAAIDEAIMRTTIRL